MKLFSWLLLIVMSITIVALCLHQGQNMLLISVMALSPIVMIFHPIKNDLVVQSFLLFFFVLSVSNIINLDSFRMESFLYTILFVISFLLLRDNINRGEFSLEDIVTYLRYLIYAYTFVLVLQQICVFAGQPVFNQLYVFENKWKLPSLALEPSHMPRYVFFMMYTYITLRNLCRSKRGFLFKIKHDYWVWFCYLWLMLTCASTTGILFFLLIFLQGMNLSFKHILAVGCIVIIGTIGLNVMIGQFEAVQRSYKFLDAFFSFSIETLDGTDHSASFRFVPFYAYFENIDVFSGSFWIGAGMDAGKELCRKYMLYLSKDVTFESNVNIGGMMAFIYDYGIFFIISLGNALYQLFKDCKDKMIIMIWIVVSMVESINMQMFWFSLTMLTIITYFQKQYKNKNETNKATCGLSYV